MRKHEFKILSCFESEPDRIYPNEVLYSCAVCGFEWSSVIRDVEKFTKFWYNGEDSYEEDCDEYVVRRVLHE